MRLRPHQLCWGEEAEQVAHQRPLPGAWHLGDGLEALCSPGSGEVQHVQDQGAAEEVGALGTGSRGWLSHSHSTTASRTPAARISTCMLSHRLVVKGTPLGGPRQPVGAIRAVHAQQPAA